MGYHVGGLIIHLTSVRRNDFLEMTLHHTVAIYLYGGSYLMNVWETGAVIAYIHDFTDITVALLRILTETKSKNATAFVFVSHILLWGYMRNVVFPNLILTCWTTPIDFGHWCILPIYVFMLSCLLLLHTHWFIIFFKLLWKLATTAGSSSYEDVMEKTETTKVQN